ncbi:MAG TPA: FAD-dependent oxidoreductase [Deltaproteobacteria bacterium]|jgi:2,4-dienoyl-CoA reductase-like NADH-dependent reductase (Old Yellow Enzyme family)/thioredoxin reductase|nr:FAD-dependent oxidoreductase [Deltaproteobacteria bacterium]MDI9542074.1 FAD-dependent oxidoreductase [Pseudomonadota bacterium]HOD71809.1 FAD-dependent oxidoreductase [Deltaproteobacteria bacterium]HQM21367.1 FAD-dependent oxidoreductase [Deltaproteobacteria bacterium]HQQ15377.1 FAD-dependent oxidoreductase [Deltaproteobacteria bacterium]
MNYVDGGCMKLDHLFSPFTLKGMTLKNRAVMPAMGTGYAGPDGTVTDRLLSYLARRAAGGTGMIITEVCAVDTRGKGFPNELGAWSDELVPSLARIPEALHRFGAKAVLQLHHAGRETFPVAAGGMPEAPSAIPSAILGQPCEEMSIARIAEVVEAFGKAAGRAKRAGFDSVEIHGAHGYLLTQFLSPFSNQRTDAYGGSEENRSRFVLEVIESVRAAVGPDYPVIIRVSSDELIRGGYDLEFMKRLSPRLVSAGVDAIHVSLGVYSTPGNLSIASMDTDPGFNLFRARAVRDASGVPVIAVGRIRPDMADEAIARGDADLVAFGRQHLCDPDFIGKLERGNIDDIRWCVSCNQGCIERLSFEMKSATCTFNPVCGREFKEDKPPAGIGYTADSLSAGKGGTPRPAANGGKVWVIGAGPAGLSAALSASERGFAVEVFEKEDSPGGQIRSASRPPRKEAFMDWVSWAVRRLHTRGVPIRFSEEVTRERLRKERPDAVILASGAMPAVAGIPGIDSDHVFDARDVLLGRVEPKSPAVILGAGYVGMETADFLIAGGVQVTVLEMQTVPPVGKFTAHGYWLHKRIREGGGRLMLGACVTGIEPDAVSFAQRGRNLREPAAMVVTAMGARSENGLEEVLTELGIPCRVVGDARSPRRLLEAIHEGHKAGCEL